MIDRPRKKSLAAWLGLADPVTGVLTSRRIVLRLNGLRDASGRFSISAVEGVGVRSGWQKRTTRERFRALSQSMEIDTRFPTKLDTISDVPEPFRSALAESLPSGESVRLLVHAPASTTGDQRSPATVLAVTNDGWLGFGDRRWRAKIGMSATAQEVGEACAANNLAVVIPCHRVVRADRSLAGYRWGINRKRALLQKEQEASPEPRTLFHAAARYRVASSAG
jgi:O-6-methylguanine DNA methyltransferase